MDIKRVIVTVLDSVGVGECPDSYMYGDTNVNTLHHISEKYPGQLPNMEMLGFGNLMPDNIGLNHLRYTFGSYGKAKELATGKDSTSGHWELAGYIKREPFPIYPDGFPDRIIDEFKRMIGCDILGNYPASGTTIINELGEEHLKTGFPIVYTSGDSVFQLAAHEEIVPLETLYKWCRIARNILKNKDLVGRVIARPFIGDTTGNFKRTSNRRDYSAIPPENTLLDNAKIAGLSVLGIGKIEDLFAGKGLTSAVHTKSNKDGIFKTIQAIRKQLPENNVEHGIIFTNLVDFDTKYGHRRDIDGYFNALKEFDNYIPEIIGFMEREDILILTADHGNDPSAPGSDHTREYIPIIIYGQEIRRGIDLGVRNSFADIGQTVADMLKINRTIDGKSFLSELLPEADNLKIDISNFNFDLFLFEMGDYRTDIYNITYGLKNSGNTVNIFISERLKQTCSFETGECLYSTIPSNKKEHYDTIVIPLTEDGIAMSLINFNSEEPLYRTIFNELKNGNYPIVTYPDRWVNETLSYKIISKRREFLSKLREMGYQIISFKRINEKLNSLIRSNI